MSREVVKNFESREQSEGVGARVRRTIGTHGVIKHHTMNNIIKIKVN